MAIIDLISTSHSLAMRLRSSRLKIKQRSIQAAQCFCLKNGIKFRMDTKRINLILICVLMKNVGVNLSLDFGKVRRQYKYSKCSLDTM